MMFEARDPNTRNVGNTGYYPGGVYTYTKSFGVPSDWRHQTVVLEFEGVYHRSEVFVNGKRAGGRASGYALFHVVLDAFLNYGEENIIEVVAHNDDEPNGRFYRQRDLPPGPTADRGADTYRSERTPAFHDGPGWNCGDRSGRDDGL
ncbi:sugar-binding domain-containing protein [Pseudarthrobacter polychromogenes]